MRPPNAWANFDKPGYSRWLFRAFWWELFASFVLIFLQSASAESLKRTFPFAPSTGFTSIGDILGHAFGGAIATYIAVHISTAVMNPALALGLWLIGRLDLVTVAVFTVAEILGSLLASGLLLASLGTTKTGLGTPTLGAGMNVGRGILMEAIAGFIMVIFFGMMYMKGRTYRFSRRQVYRRQFWRKATPAGMAALMAFVWNGGIEAIFVKTISSGPNPIRWLGPAVVTGTWANWPVWIVGPYLGVLAGVIPFTLDAQFLRPPRRANSSPRALKRFGVTTIIISSHHGYRGGGGGKLRTRRL